MKAVIPAAGFGTRFLPLTKAQPKEMLPVVNRPTIQWVVEEAVDAGIKDIGIIIEAAKKDPNIVINGMCPIKDNNDFLNPNIPKVVVRKDDRLLYISRAPIPTNKEHGFEKANKQVCIYAFPRSVLLNAFSQNNKTNLEKIEDIEILRFVELGYEVKMIEVSASSVAVDTPDDLDKVVSLLC